MTTTTSFIGKFWYNFFEKPCRDLLCWASLPCIITIITDNIAGDEVDLVDVCLAADACSRVAGLWLEINETGPHVLGGVRVVADLGVGVQTEHLGCVG